MAFDELSEKWIFKSKSSLISFNWIIGRSLLLIFSLDSFSSNGIIFFILSIPSLLMSSCSSIWIFIIDFFEENSEYK